MPEVKLHHDGHPKYRRMVRFDWSDTPLHWVPDDPFSTHMINVLHLLLPEGERHFIKAVLEASSLVDDPELEAAIKPFIQQESWHAWAHQVVLDHLAEQGIDTKPYTERLGQDVVGGAGRSTEVLPAGVATVVAVSAPGRCGRTGAFHRDVGRVGADQPRSGLRGRRPDDARSAALARRRRSRAPLAGLRRLPTRVRELLHQSVLDVDDRSAVHRLVDRRGPISDGNDPTIDGKWRWRDWWRAAREYKLPGPWKLIVTTPIRYMRPSHHPSTEASTQMAVDYLNYSPVAKAARERARSQATPVGPTTRSASRVPRRDRKGLGCDEGCG